MSTLLFIQSDFVLYMYFLNYIFSSDVAEILFSFLVENNLLMIFSTNGILFHPMISSSLRDFISLYEHIEEFCVLDPTDEGQGRLPNFMIAHISPKRIINECVAEREVLR